MTSVCPWIPGFRPGNWADLMPQAPSMVHHPAKYSPDGSCVSNGAQPVDGLIGMPRDTEEPSYVLSGACSSPYDFPSGNLFPATFLQENPVDPPIRTDENQKRPIRRTGMTSRRVPFDRYPERSWAVDLPDAPESHSIVPVGRTGDASEFFQPALHRPCRPWERQNPSPRNTNPAQ